MINVLCPICQHHEVDEIFSIGDLDKPLCNVICKNCALIFIDPRPDEKEYLIWQSSSGRGSGHHTIKSQAAAKVKVKDSDRKIKKKVAQYLLPWIKPDSKILDIGCGFGTLLKIFYEKIGVKGDGIELNENDVRLAKELFNLNVFFGTLQFFHQNYAGKRTYDLIILHHTLEHFGEPDKELARIKDLLADEGSLYIGIPNVLNIKKRPEIFFHLGHAFNFSPFSINKLLQSCGFKIVAFSGRAAYPGGMDIIAKKAASKTQALDNQILDEGRDPQKVILYIRKRANQFKFMRAMRDSLLFWLPPKSRIKLGRIFYLWQKRH